MYFPYEYMSTYSKDTSWLQIIVIQQFEGDKFTLYKKGKTVKNPQTGMNVELPGTKVGEVTVLTSFGDTPETELSFCSYEGEAVDAENLSNYYILDK